MLKKKIFRKFLITSSVLFAFILMCMIPRRDTLKVKQELNYFDNDVSKTVVYLLDKHNYLGKSSVVISDKDIINRAKTALETLILGKNESKLPSGFKAIISSDTVIKNIKLTNKIIKVDFSKELLDIDSKNEEKMIEAIVYTLTSIEGIDKVIIFVDGQILTKLPKTKINLPSSLDRSFGINKEYDLKTYKDINSYTVYYLSKYNDTEYFIPVTKYTNSKKEKSDLIIEALTVGNIDNHLMSYLNYNTKLLGMEKKDNVYVLTFNEAIFENQTSKKRANQVEKAISYSMADTYQAKEVLFQYGQQEICKTVIKMLE